MRVRFRFLETLEWNKVAHTHYYDFVDNGHANVFKNWGLTNF